MSQGNGLQELIQRFSRNDLNPHVIAQLDLGELERRVRHRGSQIDQVAGELKNIQDAGWLNLLLNCNNHKRLLAQAVALQGEIQKDQLALVWLNTAFAQALNNQQTAIRVQQSQILDQNDAIAKQHAELKQLSEKSLEQQQTIMELHKLTDGQAEAIRQLLQRAERLQEIEEQFRREVEALQRAHESAIARIDSSNAARDAKLDEETQTRNDADQQLRSELSASLLAETRTRENAHAEVQEEIAELRSRVGANEITIRRQRHQLLWTGIGVGLVIIANLIFLLHH